MRKGRVQLVCMNVAGSTAKCTLPGADRKELRVDPGCSSCRREAADICDQAAEIQRVQ